MIFSMPLKERERANARQDINYDHAKGTQRNVVQVGVIHATGNRDRGVQD